MRRAAIQALVNAAAKLRAAVSHPGATRVVAAVSLPEIFDSQLIVFFGDAHWNEFFDRRSDDQRWTVLPQSRSLAREWRIQIPEGMIERGYRETVQDESYASHGELWFVGELSPA